MNSSTPALTQGDLPSMVARQAILDRDKKLFGYELLFRAKLSDHSANISDGDAATARVIMQALVDIGMERLVGQGVALINMTRRLLVEHELLPISGKRLGLEILESEAIDDELVNCVRELARRGYLIVLDDFVLGEETPQLVALLELADLIKLEIPGRSDADLAATIARLRRYRAKLLAEKVETYADFQHCLALGFDLFQGYFFCRPEVIGEGNVSETGLSVMRLLAALENPDNGPKELENIITADAVLSYRLLRLVNSAYFGLSSSVSSLRHAIIYLGIGNIRNWVRILALARIENRPAELLKAALVRARMCEQLTTGGKPNPRGEMAFMTGLFSMLDALLNAPMEELLDNLALPEEVAAAIGHGEGPFADLLEQVQACERAQWERLEEWDASPVLLAYTYLGAVEWADQMFGFGTAPIDEPATARR
jgi:EAL and modified HD-GYP domain-containing signal transduction protein